MEEKGKCRFGQGMEEGVVWYENEVEWKGIYRERRECMFGHLWWKWVGKWF